MATLTPSDGDPTNPVHHEPGVVVATTSAGPSSAIVDSLPSSASPIFDVQKVQKCIEKKEFGNLKVYINEFTTSYHHDKGFHPHPGMMLTVLEIELAVLLECSEVDKANELFKNEVTPIINSLEDHLFTPLNIYDRLEVIEKYLQKVFS